MLKVNLSPPFKDAVHDREKKPNQTKKSTVNATQERKAKQDRQMKNDLLKAGSGSTSCLSFATSSCCS